MYMNYLVYYRLDILFWESKLIGANLSKPKYNIELLVKFILVVSDYWSGLSSTYLVEVHFVKLTLVPVISILGLSYSLTTLCQWNKLTPCTHVCGHDKVSKNNQFYSKEVTHPIISKLILGKVLWSLACTSATYLIRPALKQRGSFVWLKCFTICSYMLSTLQCH